MIVKEGDDPNSNVMENIDTNKLRKETQQLLLLTHKLAKYFIILSVIYLIQTTVAYFSLEKKGLTDYFDNPDYAEEMYGLIHSVCAVNVIHALTLLSLGVFVAFATRKFKILNSKHYKQLGVLTVLITIVYFLPIILVTYKAYDDSTSSERNAHKGAYKRFIDMLFYILVRSEQGVWGVLFATIIHF